MSSIVLSDFTATTCLGVGKMALWQGLQQGASGLAPCTFDTIDFATWAGTVEGLDDLPLPARSQRYECRNNRLAALGLRADGFDLRVQEAIARYGASRVAVILGTSTSGIYSTERAYRERAYRERAGTDAPLPQHFAYAPTHNTFSVADFVRHALGIEGPAAVISTACSSSAKVFASAARLLQAGVVDAAVVGGVDTLCLTTLYGFKSLGLTSDEACRPYDAARKGLSIGEAAAYALLERADAAHLAPNAVLLSGYGETSDAYHMSAPHPEGLGAQAAMRSALQMAGLNAGDVGYINLHGTATPSNDQSEGRAVAAVLGPTPCSSTKGATGHTLGAAGGVEAVIAAMALQHQAIPGSPHTRALDPEIAVEYVLQPRPAPGLRHVLSNSFGFGGSNCSLVLSTAGAGR